MSDLGEEFDIEAVQAVSQFLIDRSIEGHRDYAAFDDMPVVAADEHEHEHVQSVVRRMNVTKRAKVLIGIYYSERFADIIAPQYRQVQLIVCNRVSAQQGDACADARSGVEKFGDLHPNAEIGMFCDWLWMHEGHSAIVPSVFTNAESEQGRTAASLVAV